MELVCKVPVAMDSLRKQVKCSRSALKNELEEMILVLAAVERNIKIVTVNS